MTQRKKSSKTEVAAKKARCAYLERLGYTYYDISEELGVTISQVSKWIKEVQEEYKLTRITDKERLIAEKMAQYADIRKEAWLAYLQSKNGIVNELVQQVLARLDKLGVGEEIGELKLNYSELPAGVFLRIAADALEAERELLGLDAPKQVEQKNVNQNFNLNWDALCQEVPKELVDEIELQIEAVPIPLALTTLPVSTNGNGSTNGIHKE